MSYCRFSSNDYDCDAYVYEDVAGGITVIVASNRVVIDRTSLGPWVTPENPESIDLFAARHLKLMALLKDCKRVPIGLSRDGEYYSQLDAEDAYDLLVSLKEEGYHVPDFVIADIKEEMEAT